MQDLATKMRVWVDLNDIKTHSQPRNRALRPRHESLLVFIVASTFVC